MRQINLREFASAEYTLSMAERDTLLDHATRLSLTVTPISGGGSHRLTAGATVGAVEMDDLSVLIEPKIPIPQLLSLACYATEAINPRKSTFDFSRSEALPDTLALALASAARSAFARGLLHGYRAQDEALHTVRGRIRLETQMRRRFGMALPVDVTYDEFTEDILANRLVRAATERLRQMRLRSRQARRGLGSIAATLQGVTPVEIGPWVSGDVPEVRFDRLNEHYRQVVGLSSLILRHSAFESRRGSVRASGFLMDVGPLFQEFVTVALRESLGVDHRTLCTDRNIPKTITLDEGGTDRLEPDLSWWDGPDCAFVGDVKYKELTGRSAPNSDLYQLLAYTIALDLPGGLLIYAQGEEVDLASLRVRHSGKRLEIAALDLSGTLEEVLEQVDRLAAKVERLRDEALRRLESQSSRSPRRGGGRPKYSRSARSRVGPIRNAATARDGSTN